MNSSFLNTTNCTDAIPLDKHLWSEYLEMGFNVMAVITGVPINCWSLLRYKKLWRTKRANRRVLLGISLTLSNLLILLIYCTSQTAWLAALWWPWGERACIVRSFLIVLVYHLSSNSLVLIALEMCYTIHKPLKSFQDTGIQRTAMQISFCVLLAFVCSCPQLFTWGLVDIPGDCSGKRQCVFLYQNDNTFYVAYQFCHAITVFYVPLVLIVGCYIACGVVIGKKLRRRARLQAHSSLTEKESVEDYGSSGCKSRFGGSKREMRRNSRRVKRKLFKASAAVICSYILCWLPYQSLTVWETILKIQTDDDYLNGTEPPAILSYMYFSEALMICGAVINPFLYSYNGY